MWQTCCKKQKVNIQMFKKVLVIQNETFNNKFSLIWEKDGLNSNLIKKHIIYQLEWRVSSIFGIPFLNVKQLIWLEIQQPNWYLDTPTHFLHEQSRK